MRICSNNIPRGESLKFFRKIDVPFRFKDALNLTYKFVYDKLLKQENCHTETHVSNLVHFQDEKAPLFFSKMRYSEVKVDLKLVRFFYLIYNIIHSFI